MVERTGMGNLWICAELHLYRCIGFSSDTKKGYDVKVLIEFINNILDSEEPMKIGIIGMQL